MDLSLPISEMMGIYFWISTKRVCLFFIFRAHHQQSIMEKMVAVISSVSQPPCENLDTLPIKKVDSMTRYMARKPMASAFGTRFCNRKTVIRTVVTIKLMFIASPYAASILADSRKIRMTTIQPMSSIQLAEGT